MPDAAYLPKKKGVELRVVSSRRHAEAPCSAGLAHLDSIRLVMNFRIVFAAPFTVVTKDWI
jgi:hypothetical protein